MKRSEMMKLIQGLLECPTTFEDPEGGAENLLCHLEQKGMLPPHVNKMYSWDCQGPGHYWEPEEDVVRRSGAV